ncbi:Imm12 family immunity protein [Apibacter adventoris]|uniref:Immunity protein 12 domain-containing protein n=1 Tax=Apibacter adventoris TaxID=1679466 RepID=A0A2S8AFU1_9FLAO|nr:Imm12 family immunity protein [Apibacter adventoris]PQL95245.1 hypothetical protein C4S77_00100 [Apibacter adventoris]
MDIYLNSAFGGESKAKNTLFSLNIVIRKSLKKVFNDFHIEKVKEIEFYLGFNGDLTKYKETSGIYSPRYSSKKESFVVNIIFDDTKWGDNQIENKRIFITELETYFFDAGVILNNKLKKIKIEFNLNEYKARIKKALYNV